MKKIFTVITLIFLFCNVFTSCNNSFLDEVPNHQLSDVSFWKTEDDVYKYTIGLYRYTLAPENHAIMTDCYTDNAVPVHVTVLKENFHQEQQLQQIHIFNKCGNKLFKVFADVILALKI